MAAKQGRKERRRAMCAGKHRYPTRVEAERAARGMARRWATSFAAFRCGDHFHVGHNGRGRAARR